MTGMSLRTRHKKTSVQRIDPASWALTLANEATPHSHVATDARPELELRRALKAAGAAGYRVQWPVPGQATHTIDIAFVGAKLAVMVDSCWWHGCPEHYVPPRANFVYWSSRVEANMADDATANAALRVAGWQVLRFWSHEDPVESAAVVVGALSARVGVR